MLSLNEIDEFVRKGFVRIPQAFSPDLADQCQDILWRDTGCDKSDKFTWTRPVVRLSNYSDLPFVQAANSEKLIKAYDQLVGPGRWLPVNSLGSFPIRFPHLTAPDDTGWHVDASFPGENLNNYLEWRVNIFSKGRSLLMLFLFSDVGPLDAPTRIAVGSHLNVARILYPYGEKGLPFMELAEKCQDMPYAEEVQAEGQRGTVYLCHPFLLHAAQAHTGDWPRFMAQPPLLPAAPGTIWQKDLPGKEYPVTTAIQLALHDWNWQNVTSQSIF